jgi:transcriptional regulator with XRE-family HTH domain
MVLTPGSMYLGERLRRTRKAKGLTLQQLAGKAGLDIAAISRLEREPRDPRASSLAKLADALDVSVSFLMAAEDQSLEFSVALRHQSLQRFLVTNPISDEQKRHFEQICFFDSGPNSVRGWQDLVQNASFLLAQRAIE